MQQSILSAKTGGGEPEQRWLQLIPKAASVVG